MAQSRLERIGTIYSRTKTLLRGGAMKPEDKPLWYAVYEAFPPKVEPRFDREVPKTPIREIFYKEDVIRAKFQSDNKNFLSATLFNTKHLSNTQQFLSIYEEMEKSGIPEEELYAKALESYRAQVESFRQAREATGGEPKEKTEDKTAEKSTVDLRKVFDE